MKAPDLQEKLQESEKLIEEMSKTWEEKLQQTERIHKVQVGLLANKMYNIRYRVVYWWVRYCWLFYVYKMSAVVAFHEIAVLRLKVKQ